VKPPVISEITARGDNTMKEYYNRSEGTDTVLKSSRKIFFFDKLILNSSNKTDLIRLRDMFSQRRYQYCFLIINPLLKFGD
jgi:hypothetical protein